MRKEPDNISKIIIVCGLPKAFGYLGECFGCGAFSLKAAPLLFHFCVGLLLTYRIHCQSSISTGQDKYDNLENILIL